MNSVKCINGIEEREKSLVDPTTSTVTSLCPLLPTDLSSSLLSLFITTNSPLQILHFFIVRLEFHSHFFNRFAATILFANLSANSPLQFYCCNLGEFKLCALEQIHPFMVQTYPIGCIFSFIFYHIPICHTIVGRESQYIWV